MKIYLVVPLTLFGQINSNGDYQLWQWDFLKYQITDEWTLFTTLNARWGNQISQLFYGYIQPQIVYSPQKWVAIAPGYRQAARRTPLTSSHWIPEYIPLADITFYAKPGKWEIHNRNRVEYTISEITDFPWLFRTRLRFYLPVHWTSLKIRPFFDNEIFWRQAAGINEDRLSAGFKMIFSDNWGSDIYYMARFHAAEPHWVYQNVFNFTINMKY